MFQLLQVKVKFTLEQATRTQKEREREHRCSSTLSLTPVLDGVSAKRHPPAVLFSGKRPGSHCTGG